MARENRPNTVTEGTKADFLKRWAAAMQPRYGYKYDRSCTGMSGKFAAPRAVAEAMLEMVDASGVEIADGHGRFSVTIAGVTITVGDGSPYPFERLASAIEARIAFERTTAMIAAANEKDVPLWLVSGSSVLGRWLAWSRSGRALMRVLRLTDQVDGAPVVGQFARRARHALGQVPVRIRVSAGQAVAERIELSHRVPAIAVLGDKAIIRIRRQHLAETIVIALQDDPGRNDRWRAAEIVDHPFFAANDLMVANIRNDRGDVVFELEAAWEPLAPIPKSAWETVPRDADPAFPWRATSVEVAKLNRLASCGERLLREGG